MRLKTPLAQVSARKRARTWGTEPPKSVGSRSRIPALFRTEREKRTGHPLSWLVEEIQSEELSGQRQGESGRFLESP